MPIIAAVIPILISIFILTSCHCEPTKPDNIILSIERANILVKPEGVEF